MLILKKGSVLKVRYLIKFTKDSHIKFISHLDLMRTIQRIIKRGDLPIEYSQGFNPHMSLSIAQPLSVGTHSEGEYMDIVLREELSEKEVKERLNASCPSGIKMLEVKKVESLENVKKTPQAMALIDAASYTIKMRYEGIEDLEAQITSLLETEQWTILKKSKSGEKMVDIKPMIKTIKYWTKEDFIVFNVLISCGSRENLSPDLLSQYIKESTKGFKENSFIDIKREEMYAYKNNKLVPIYKYV